MTRVTSMFISFSDFIIFYKLNLKIFVFGFVKYTVTLFYYNLVLVISQSQEKN